VIVFHSEDSRYIGVLTPDKKVFSHQCCTEIYKVQVCCTQELKEAHECSEIGEVIVQRNVSSTLWIHDLLTASNSSQDTLHVRHDISKSGIYYIYFIYCNESDIGAVTLNGKSTFMNPYGYLNGELYPYLPVCSAQHSIPLSVHLVLWSGESLLRAPCCRLVHQELPPQSSDTPAAGCHSPLLYFIMSLAPHCSSLYYASLYYVSVLVVFT
jgi:hypothetical protein